MEVHELCAMYATQGTVADEYSAQKSLKVGIVIYGLQYDDRVQLISGVPMIVLEIVHLEKEAKFDHGPYEPTKDEKYSDDMRDESKLGEVVHVEDCYMPLRSFQGCHLMIPTILQLTHQLGKIFGFERIKSPKFDCKVIWLQQSPSFCLHLIERDSNTKLPEGPWSANGAVADPKNLPRGHHLCFSGSDFDYFIKTLKITMSDLVKINDQEHWEMADNDPNQYFFKSQPNVRNRFDLYVLRFYNRLDEEKKGEIACAKAGETRKWIEAFDQAKQQAEFELSQSSSRNTLSMENEIDLEGRRPRVRRYAHDLKKLIRIGHGPKSLVRRSSNLGRHHRSNEFVEGDVADVIEAHEWRCVRTVNGVRIFEDVSDHKVICLWCCGCKSRYNFGGGFEC
ncbi:hypothetical protein L1887_34400 [Cichorium endivia]|nr:hypothetical protein L1887_34400 [Cichorium endivia]